MAILFSALLPFVTDIGDPNSPAASTPDDSDDDYCSNDDISGRVGLCQADVDVRTRRDDDVAVDDGWDSHSLPPDSNSEQSSDYVWVE